MSLEKAEDYQCSKILFKLVNQKRNRRRKIRIRIRRIESSQVWQQAQSPLLKICHTLYNHNPLGSSRPRHNNIHSIFTQTWNQYTQPWHPNITIYNKIIVDKPKEGYIWGQVWINSYCSTNSMCVLLD